MNKNMFYALAGVIAFWLGSSLADCDLDRTNINQKSPIVLKDTYTSFTYLIDAMYLPNSQKINIPEGTSVYLSCPDTVLFIDGIPYGSTTRQFTCSRGKFDGTLLFTDIECKDIPRSYDINNRPQKFEVGFNIDGHLLTEYEGEYDDDLEITKYARYLISYEINDLVIDTTRPCFEDIWSFHAQVRTLKSLFTNPAEQAAVEGYFKERSQYLAKGHLASHRDFNFPYSQRATYYMDNVVPQWQQVNNGNWKRLEGDIRQLATQRKHTLAVYTGIHEISKLFGTELYLYNRGTKHTPIPRFMWKVVIDNYATPSATGVVFVMSNNPNDKTESISFVCPDVCPSLSYINVGVYNPGGIAGDGYKRGYLYCCELTLALQAVITNMPPLGALPLLT